MIELLILIAVCGVIVWFVTTYVPMPAAFKSAIVIIAVIGLVLYTLQAFGVTHWRLPR